MAIHKLLFLLTIFCHKKYSNITVYMVYEYDSL